MLQQILDFQRSNIMNAGEIVKAWITSFNPSTDEKNMALARKKVCDECPSNKEVLKKRGWTSICKECGCPISKKIYTKSYNPCPLEKWLEVDDMFFEDKKIEKRKRLL